MTLNTAAQVRMTSRARMVQDSSSRGTYTVQYNMAQYGKVLELGKCSNFVDRSRIDLLLSPNPCILQTSVIHIFGILKPYAIDW